MTLKVGEQPTEAIRRELAAHVRKAIGAIATPDVIHRAPGLPKTRSGKIMRRILRNTAASDLTDLGDTTTLADESLVKAWIDSRPR